MGNWLWGHHYIESDKTHTDSNERTSEEPSQEESESEENNEEQQSTTGSSESIIDDHISSQEEDPKLGVHYVVFSHQEREGGQGEGSHEDETSSLCNTTTTTTTTSKPADVSVTTKLGFCESDTPSSQIPSSNKQKHHPGTEQSHKHIHFDPEANGKTMTKDNEGKEKKGHSATAQANNCTSMPGAFANISQRRSPTDATQFKSRNKQVHLEGNAKTKLQMETFEARNDEESAVEKGGSVQLIKEAIAPVVASNLVTWESFTKLGKVSISFESKKSNAPTACKKESRSRKRMKVNKRVTYTERWDIWSRLCEPVMKVGTAQHTFEPTLIKYNMATDERQFDEKPQVEIPSGHPRFQNAKGPIQDDAIPKDHKGEAVQHLDQSARFGNKDASPGIINEVCQDLEEFQSKGVVEDKEDFLSLHSIATNQNESIRGKCKDVNKAKAKQKYKKKYMKKYKKKCNKKRKKNRRKRANNRAYNKVKNKVKYSKSSFQERPVFTRKDCQADTEKNDATSIEKDHTCLETKTKAMDNFTEKGQEEEKVVWKPFCMASDGCKHHKAKKNAAVARSHQILQDDFTSLENMPEWYASLMVFAILIGGTPFYLQRLQRPQQK